MARAQRRRALANHRAARQHWLTLRALLVWRRHRQAVRRHLRGAAVGLAALVYFAGIFSLFALTT